MKIAPGRSTMAEFGDRRIPHTVLGVCNCETMCLQARCDGSQFLFGPTEYKNPTLSRTWDLPTRTCRNRDLKEVFMFFATNPLPQSPSGKTIQSV